MDWLNRIATKNKKKYIGTLLFKYQGYADISVCIKKYNINYMLTAFKKKQTIACQLEHEKRSASKKMQFSNATEARAVSKHWIFRGQRLRLQSTSDDARRHSPLSLCRE